MLFSITRPLMPLSPRMAHCGALIAAGQNTPTPLSRSIDDSAIGM